MTRKNPEFPQIAYQPHSVWSEKLKAMFYEHISYLKEDNQRKGFNDTGREILDDSLLVAVGKDPHDGEFYAWTVTSAACHKTAQTVVQEHDPYLVKLAKLPDLRQSTIKELVAPAAKKVLRDGYLPEVPTKGELFETVHPQVLEIGEELKSWAYVGAPAAAMLVVAGLTPYESLNKAIASAGQVIGNGVVGGGVILVLGLSRLLMQKLPLAFIRERKLGKATPEVDFYSNLENEPGLISI